MKAAAIILCVLVVAVIAATSVMQLGSPGDLPPAQDSDALAGAREALSRAERRRGRVGDPVAAAAGDANRIFIVPDGEGEDGILTAEEIASLDLTGVEWVVLSACAGLSRPLAPAR